MSYLGHQHVNMYVIIVLNKQLLCMNDTYYV